MRITMLVVALLLTATVQAENDDEADFVSMFNGEDLTGWEGMPGRWHVEDGAITGVCNDDPPCDVTHYLYWTEQKPGDFVLRVKFKLVGGNSGIHVRSERRPDFDIWGYQADFSEEEEWIGCLYQHDRGAVVKRGYKAVIEEDGTRTDERIACPEELLAVYNEEDWNEYEIVCEGSVITLRINGVKMCEVDDRDATFARDSGLIALQMHAGPAMKVQFKDLRIKITDE